jgi:glycosyltransferase involved in cell wall biosynthesis
MLPADTKKRAVVASLHFSPAHASHMIAIAKLLIEMDYEVTFLLHRRYEGFANFAAVGEVVFRENFREWRRRNQSRLAVFVNAALDNAIVAAPMRQSGTDVRYIFHEPSVLRNRFGEGPKAFAKLAAAKLSSIAMLMVASGAIVPSRCALALYLRHFLCYNRAVNVIPLLFDEEIAPGQSIYNSARRRYFSFLGNACEAHNFRAFVAFAKYGIRLECGFDFAIAARTDLKRLLEHDEEFAGYVKEGKILLQHGRVLSGAEMDAKYLDSFCVWNLYKYSTQSGVLPRAFMTGTAVIAARMGSFEEFVKPGVNGEFVESAADFDAIIQAAKKIRQNIPAYVQGCRASFFDTFHYRAGRKALAAILSPQATANQVGSGNLPQPRPADAD